MERHGGAWVNVLAESATGAVALDHRDLVGGVAQLHGDGDVGAGRAAAEAQEGHVRLPLWGEFGLGAGRFKLED